MPPQRVRDAENRTERNSSNGPLRVQSKDVSSEYSATRGHASVAGDMLVSRRVYSFSVKQGGTADYVDSSLTDSLFLHGICQGFFLSQKYILEVSHVLS